MPKTTSLITHTPKFNIGDTIYHRADKERIRTVFAILHGKQSFVGNWAPFVRSTPLVASILEVEDCYILTNNQNPYITFLRFGGEQDYFLLSSGSIESITIKKSFVSSCPKCKEGELVDWYSDWAKENIKKCRACGWC
jgi:hypothetical protein